MSASQAPILEPSAPGTLRQATRKWSWRFLILELNCRIQICRETSGATLPRYRPTESMTTATDWWMTLMDGITFTIIASYLKILRLIITGLTSQASSEL